MLTQEPDAAEAVAPRPVVGQRWELDHLLGRGAVADVFSGRDVTTGREVAVKVLRETSAETAARFQREIDALRGLDHDGIVGIVSHGVADGRPFVVLDRVGGGTLADRLAADGAMDATDAAALGAVLADALAHAHERGVVHRDVKPSNVLLDVDGRPKIGDFGIAFVDGAAALTGSGFTVGTVAYLAPEQVRGEDVTPSTDVYALGLVLLEAITGRQAFPGNGLPAAAARLERDPAVPAGVPAPMAQLLVAMTQRAPQDRPAMPVVATRLRAVASAADANGTTLLPTIDDETVVVPAPAAVAAAGGRRQRARRSDLPQFTMPRFAGPVAAFVAGCLLVLGIRLAAGAGLDVRAAVGDPPADAPPTVCADLDRLLEVVVRDARQLELAGDADAAPHEALERQAHDIRVDQLRHGC